MKNSFLKYLGVYAITLFLYNSPSYAQNLTLFTTEQEAKASCPNDTVVWLNLPTCIWHYKYSQWYGNTEHGSYVCEQAAIDAGCRASKNGS